MVRCLNCHRRENAGTLLGDVFGPFSIILWIVVSWHPGKCVCVGACRCVLMWTEGFVGFGGKRQGARAASERTYAGSRPPEIISIGKQRAARGAERAAWRL
eukprot:363418-Chlamydomonas_euryale.AAC.1